MNFASEAGLAVLVALRYLPGDPAGAPDDYVLGWTEVDATPERVPDEQGEQASRAFVTRWLEERRSLLAAVRSKVLPEADVVMMNPAHPDAARVPPLVTRPFSFAECLHTPPMRDLPIRGLRALWTAPTACAIIQGVDDHELPPDPDLDDLPPEIAKHPPIMIEG